MSQKIIDYSMYYCMYYCMYYLLHVLLHISVIICIFALIKNKLNISQIKIKNDENNN